MMEDVGMSCQFFRHKFTQNCLPIYLGLAVKCPDEIIDC